MKDFKFLLKLFTDKKINYKSLEVVWADLYMNSGIYESLTEKDQEVLDSIHEKIEYTAENPGEDVQWGYITPVGLSEWIMSNLNLD